MVATVGCQATEAHRRPAEPFAVAQADERLQRQDASAVAEAAAAELQKVAWIVAQTDPLATPAAGAPTAAPVATAVAVDEGFAAQEAVGELPPPLADGIQPLSAPASGAAVETLLPPPLVGQLDLQLVVAAAVQSFPSVREAALLRDEALGASQRALGEFDDRLEAFTVNQPLGYYENYRHGVSWTRPLETGGAAYAGYRIGRGHFEPWYGGRITDESGEFRIGFEIPLLRSRAIDSRRTAVRLAGLDLQKSDPQLYQQVLAAQYEAAEAYWQWVAFGQQYQVAGELMRLAEERVERIQRQIDAEDVARIVGIDNRRLLALRRSRLIEARQRWDNAAVRLSLYFRDGGGRPITVTDDSLPEIFPAPPNAFIDVPTDISSALEQRPEMAILRVSGEQLRAELRLAINQQLPEVAFSTEASKDVGPLASPTGDKRPFILETGLVGSVPVQRRSALGRARSLRAQLAQLDARTQLAADRIANDVRQAAIAYQAAQQRLEQAVLGRDLAEQTLQAGEVAFAAGDIDILLLNIYEQAFADAGLEVIDARAAMHIAYARWLTAKGELLLASMNKDSRS